MDPLVNAGDHHARGRQHHRSDLAAVVDDNQSFFEQDARTGLESCDPCAVGAHFVRPEALPIGNDSRDRAFHVVDLADVPPTVVVAKDDADDRFGQASWRRPRALNLDAIVSADGGLTAGSPVTMIVVVLTIGAHQLRAAHPIATATAHTVADTQPIRCMCPPSGAPQDSAGSACFYRRNPAAGSAIVFERSRSAGFEVLVSEIDAQPSDQSDVLLGAAISAVWCRDVPQSRRREPAGTG